MYDNFFSSLVCVKLHFYHISFVRGVCLFRIIIKILFRFSHSISMRCCWYGRMSMQEHMWTNEIIGHAHAHMFYYNNVCDRGYFVHMPFRWTRHIHMWFSINIYILCMHVFYDLAYINKYSNIFIIMIIIIAVI